MQDTANSSPIRVTKIPKGINVIKNITIPAENNCNNKVDKIFNNVCPATKLAKSRIPKEKALAMYEINSISTNSGTKPSGVPEGIK